MHESEVESGLEPQKDSQPNEIQSAILVTLMRIYDVQMALLTHFDTATADAIYAKHEQGEDYNPTIFIPTMVRREP